MAKYSEERKQAVIAKMMPPENRSIPDLARETGITSATLYNWRSQAKARGAAVPGDGKNPEAWSPENKLAVVIETAALNEAELAEYCRRKGLFVEQIEAWKAACLRGARDADGLESASREQAKRYRKRVRELERDLRQKEKALAETAALLVLRKKANAIWGKDEDE
jgi:transposase-like protein